MKNEIHEGEALRVFLDKEKIEITNLAKELNVSRTTVYNWLEMPKLKFDNLQKLRKQLRIDFLREINISSSKDLESEVLAKETYSTSNLSITINLDGTSEKLESAIKKLIDLNDALKK